MAYDPLNSSKNRDPGEYAGLAGMPQPKAAGHVTLTPQEKRMIVQQEVMASAGVMEDLDPSDEHYSAVEDLAIRRAEIYRSGHTLDDALG